MKESKKRIVLVSIVTAVIAVVALFAIPWLIIYAGLWLSPDPPKPQTTYGEFAFELVYTIDGEVHTINDAVVCEYDGIAVDEGVGKHNKWKGYLKSSGKEELVLYEEGGKRITCAVGSPEFYMNEPGYYDVYEEHEVVPRLFLYEEHGEITSSCVLSDAEALEYGIVLVSWHFSEPISNKYE